MEHPEAVKWECKRTNNRYGTVIREREWGVSNREGKQIQQKEEEMCGR